MIRFRISHISQLTAVTAIFFSLNAGAVELNSALDCLNRIRPNGASNDAIISLTRKLPSFFGRANNKSSVVLIDYSLHNNKNRLFLIDLVQCQVTFKEKIAHGGRWFYFYDANGKRLPDSKGRVTYDTFSPGDPGATDYLVTCINPETNDRTHMTRPGFTKTAGCHTTGRNGWTTLWKQGGRDCHGIILRGLEPSKQGNMTGVVMHEHNRFKPDTVGQGCPMTRPGVVQNLIAKSAANGFDVRNETLVYIHAPACDN